MESIVAVENVAMPSKIARLIVAASFGQAHADFNGTWLQCLTSLSYCLAI